MEDYLKVSDVDKYYGVGESRTKVLDKVSFSLEKGKICAILGPSGSGKSTLLNLIGGLDRADAGEIVVNSKCFLSEMKAKGISRYRREYLGFIFQFYNLIPNLTVKENIEVCSYLTKKPLEIDEILKTIGMHEHRNKFPSQLSGGQQQRCAIARSFSKNPQLLLCDEPTGALDTKSAKDVLMLIEEVNKKYGTTILIVTHNNDITRMANVVLRMKDGKITSYEKNNQVEHAKDIEW